MIVTPFTWKSKLIALLVELRRVSAARGMMWDSAFRFLDFNSLSRKGAERP